MAPGLTLTVRGVAAGLGIGFCLYFVARGLWWTSIPLVPPLMVAALVLYLAAMLTAILVHDDRRGRAPLWTALGSIVSGAAVPTLAMLAMAPGAREEPFATWYIGAVGLLSVVLIARRRPYSGWIILLLLCVSAALWLGLADALRLGLVGSILWAVVAQFLVLMWARAVRDTERLAEVQRDVSSWHAAQQVRHRERRRRVQFAVSVAGPVLGTVIAQHGSLTDRQRTQAWLAEGRLRDEIRGGALLGEHARARIDAIRAAGGTVTVIDDGGLEGLSAERKEELRDELARVLEDAEGLRIIIRAARHPETAITVVGRTQGSTDADEDAVALWATLPRETAS